MHTCLSTCVRARVLGMYPVFSLCLFVCLFSMFFKLRIPYRFTSCISLSCPDQIAMGLPHA